MNNALEITALMKQCLAQKPLLRRYLDILYKILGIFIDFVAADGTVLELYSNYKFNPYCAALRSIPDGPCRECDQLHHIEARAGHKPLRYLCHAGMMELIVPVYDSRGEYLGSITSGQFRHSGERGLSRGEIAELAKKHHLPQRRMYEAYHASVQLSEEQIEGVLLYLETIGELLARAYTNFAYLNRINSPDRIANITKYIEENYMKRLSVASVAREFFLSPGYFAHIFRREVGRPFNTYLTRFRVERAREILMETRLPVGEIAALTGFGSLSQFNRSFMSCTGISPSAYRREHSAPAAAKRRGAAAARKASEEA